MKKRPLEDQDIDEVLEACADAGEAIGFAVLHCMNKEEGNGCLRLLGVKMALLRHAARLAIVGEETCGAKNTVEIFTNLARREFEQIMELWPPKLGGA